MSPTRPLLAALSVLALAACQAQAPATSASPLPAAQAAPADADLVARGEYLVRISGCNDCHTPGWDQSQGRMDKAQWLVGSPVGFRGPWGTTYASNLRNRVAGMDEAQWLAYTGTLTTRPVMPYYNLTAMTEADRRAMYRFIRSLGDAGGPAPAYLPPDQAPQAPYFEVVLPPAPAAGAAHAAGPAPAR